MAKHHHQSKAEQIDNKAHGAKPFHFEKRAHDSSTQARANQVDHEKDISALEDYRKQNGV